MNDRPLALPAPDARLLLPAPDASTARRPSPRLIVGAIVVLLVLSAIGWFFHHRQASRAQEANEKDRDRLPSVAVVTARASSGTSDLLLPGSVTAITEASLYARAAGYLRTRSVDIGDSVQRGQVLAEIDSPDLDQQVAQGRAAVAQARQQLGQAQSAVVDAQARVGLARVVAQRAEVLGRDEAISQQEVDQRRQELDTAQASLASSQANVGASRENIRAGEANAKRLVVLQDYEKLRAPFDGVVTARNVDVGALIGSGGSASSSSGTSNASSSDSGSSSSGMSATGSSAGGGLQDAGGAQQPLFRVAQVDRLRVFVNVPQENAGAVETGTDASVFVAGHRDPFHGKVARTARALDPSARTLLTEVQIDNARHVLMPGLYAQVRFHSPRSNAPVLVPGEAIVARADGLHVALVEDLRDQDRSRLPKSVKPEDADKTRRVHLQPVQTGRDYGTEVEVTDGLQAGATIVANPGDDAVEDALIVPKPPKDEGKGSGKLGADRPPQGNESPSMQAPTKKK